MRISFDIDETLVCRKASGPCETGLGATIARYLFDDPLRLGARILFSELRARGHEVWIYTTSLRTEPRTRTWLWLHGIEIDGFVNFPMHCNSIKALQMIPAPSKFPPSFGIDLHIDDLDGVAIEGTRHGFKVLVVRSDDLDWAEKVLDAEKKMRESTAK